MKVLIFRSRERAVVRAAGEIVQQLQARPASVLGLATGGTMDPVYAALIAAARDGQVAFDRATMFNLDEYVGVPPDHPRSYEHYMRTHFFDALNLPDRTWRLPRGDAPDPAAEAEAYEARIAEAGGIDLQLLGIGANGHIGFNEPSSSLSSRTRVKTLHRRTRDDNARFFGPDEVVPTTAITMGIATILDSRHALLLATGAAKAQAVAAMIEGPVSARCPASALQLHRHATVVLDEDAAQALELRDYYDTVHPDGEDGQMPAMRIPGLEPQA